MACKRRHLHAQKQQRGPPVAANISQAIVAEPKPFGAHAGGGNEGPGSSEFNTALIYSRERLARAQGRQRGPRKAVSVKFIDAEPARVWCLHRAGNEGPGEHRAVEKQEQGPPPDTRETGGLPPPKTPFFAALIPNFWRARRRGNEGPGEHRAVEKLEQGPPPDTR